MPDRDPYWLHGVVVDVVSGDTFIMSCEPLERIDPGEWTVQRTATFRLIDLRAPEAGEPSAAEARAMLLRLCPVGSDPTVIVQADCVADARGRLAAAVECYGVDVASGLLDQGLAWCTEGCPDFWRSAEERAKQAGRGVWADPTWTPPA